jgi:hypothetical protein
MHQGGRVVPLGLFQSLALVAKDADHSDLELIYEASRRVASSAEAEQEAAASEGDPARNPTEQVVSELIAAMGVDHLTRAIDIAIDGARASFVIESSSVRTSAEFSAIIESFYLHLERFTGRGGGPVAINEARANALEVLARAFSRSGGLAAARAQAISGTQGGLRVVLDQLTEQYKAERQHAHTTALLDRVERMNWDARVAVVEELTRRCPSLVSPEEAAYGPSRYAAEVQQMLRNYVQSLNSVRLAALKM